MLYETLGTFLMQMQQILSVNIFQLENFLNSVGIATACTESHLGMHLNLQA